MIEGNNRFDRLCSMQICGYSLWLPGVDNVDDFVKLMEEKRLCRSDLVASGRYHHTHVDEGESTDPWKLHSRWGNFFTPEEGERAARLM